MSKLWKGNRGPAHNCGKVEKVEPVEPLKQVEQMASVVVDKSKPMKKEVWIAVRGGGKRRLDTKELVEIAQAYAGVGGGRAEAWTLRCWALRLVYALALALFALVVAQLWAWDGCNEPAWWAVRALSGLWMGVAL